MDLCLVAVLEWAWYQVRAQSGKEVSGVEEGVMSSCEHGQCRWTAGRVLEVLRWGSCHARTPPIRNTFFLSSFFRCPAWLKIRCIYLMAEPRQGPLSQGRMGTRRLVGILGDWEVSLGCLT